MASALIVYASLTGNTEEIADIVADQLEALGVDVEVKECTQVAPEDFLEYDMNIIATYTYGTDGDLPDEFMDFYEEMEDDDFTGKIAVVVYDEGIRMDSSRHESGRQKGNQYHQNR